MFGKKKTHLSTSEGKFFYQWFETMTLQKDN